jgi:hypothetical protein
VNRDPSGYCPDDLPEPFTEDTWRADAQMDLCVPESAEDKARWLLEKQRFAEKWKFMLFGEGCLSRKQAGGK